jgi:2-keto-4-pentenoate hydratase/2-oxohepta-3-ene-1,7-dioic acid hydratase in catechol pathway
VTAEAEIGLVIGRTCRNVSEADALDFVWGVTTILDQTAEDILRRNPRFLTRSKNFPTFFCFGPELVPLAEVLDTFGTLAKVEVTTDLNGGAETRSNTVSNMTFSPAFLVSFHSQVMPLFPGDIISTGTPGAVVITDGDTVECRIPGIGTLTNTVRRAR